MNRHGSINRIYRLIWNEALQVFVPAAETARGRGKRSTRRLAAVAMALGASLAQAAPTGGHVTAGNGTVTQSGATGSGTTTTIDQVSQNLALTWQSFNVATNDTVDFVQPSVSAIAVNRVLGSDGSVILGHVNANGQVYLINPNGVLFGEGAEVNVGGLVASALDIDQNTLADTTRTFKGSGTGAVTNAGTLTASPGGSVALLGNHVGNTGIISAKLGTVALGAGDAVTLTFNASHLVKMQIDQSVLDSEAQNGGLIQADGGTVVMTAGAQKSLLASVVNNSGVIEARTVENHAGTISLLGGMTAGTVNVGGTLDAGAPQAGDAGTIETSASRVEISPSARIATAAAHGLNGTWLIDPTDFTIAPSGGDETGAQLSTALGSTNVIIESTSGGGGTLGNINVNDTVAWSANALTLSAQNNININSTMNGSGTASLALFYGQGALNAGNTSTYHVAAPVNLPAGQNFSTKLGSDGPVIPFTVITSVGAAGDAIAAPSAATLQGMAAGVNLSGHFVLGANINASATSAWNGCTSCVNGGAGSYGFTPIGSAYTPFTGTFDGLGHTITGLTINQPNTPNIGLFGVSSGIIRNVGLIGAAVTGGSYSGALIGTNLGTVINSSSLGGVVAGATYTGGLIGQNYGTVSTSSVTGGSVNGTEYVGGLSGGNVSGTVAQSYSTASVTGTSSYVGGFVGDQHATASITDSYATGTVTGSIAAGGFIGWNEGGTLQRNYATGSVSGSDYVGGFAGYNSGTISNSYASGAVAASGSVVGGLIGINLGSIDTVHASGNVTGVSLVGGLIGYSDGPVSQSYAIGTVAGSDLVGGLVGRNQDSITSSYATGNVSGGSYAGGLIGGNYNAVTGSFASGAVSGTNSVGGLIGNNFGTVSNSYSSGNVAGAEFVGGLIGANDANVSNTYAAGGVSAPTAGYRGGLIGSNATNAVVTNSFYSTSANSADPTLTGSGGVYDTAGAIWGMSTADLQTSANFTTATTANGGVNPGWNLAATWLVYDGHTAPLLQAFMTPLTVSNTPVTAVYDGGAAFTLTLSNLTYSVTPDTTHLFGTPSIGGTANGAAHVGTYTSSVSGLYSDQLGYLITYTAGSLTITPAPVTVTGSTAAKVYDGTTTATLNGGTLVGVYAGDTLSLTQTGTFASPHAGSNIAVTATDSLGGASATDYTLVEPTGLTGTITPASLTVSGTVAGNKVYDGTTVASLSGGSLVGVVAGDTVTLSQAGTFASKNAGTGIAVTATDTVSGAAAADYTLVEPSGLTANITPASLTVSGTVAGNKVYDGTTVASLSGGSLVGVVAGDTLTLSQAGAFASKNAGTGIAVTATDTVSGAAAADYTLVEPSGLTANITPASLTVSGTVAGNKVYDGTTVASLSGGSLVGVVAGDTLTLSQAGAFASKNAGTGIAVTATDTVSGAAAADYTLVEPSGLTANITPASLTVSGTVAGNKVYDGTTVASLSGGSLVGVVAGDTLTLSQAGAFASKNAGTGIAVTATDTVSGAAAADYTLVEPSGLTANITPASLTVSGTVAGNKVYDGTTVASLSGGSLVGVVAGDTLTLSQAGAFATKNAGTGIAVTATDTVSGAAAGDYTLVEPSGLTANITPASLTVSGTVAGNKVYDGTTVASLSGGSLVGVVSGDNVTLSQSGLFASSSAGTNIPVTATDSLSGTSASDYTLVEPTGLSGTIYPSFPLASAETRTALAVRAQIEADLLSPSFGDNPRNINVTMKFGTGSTLQIEKGGLRLPDNLAGGNE